MEYENSEQEGSELVAGLEFDKIERVGDFLYQVHKDGKTGLIYADEFVLDCKYDVIRTQTIGRYKYKIIADSINGILDRGCFVAQNDGEKDDDQDKQNR